MSRAAADSRPSCSSRCLDVRELLRRGGGAVKGAGEREQQCVLVTEPGVHPGQDRGALQEAERRHPAEPGHHLEAVGALAPPQFHRERLPQPGEVHRQAGHLTLRAELEGGVVLERLERDEALLHLRGSLEPRR